MGFGHKFMRFGRFDVVDVKNFMAMSDEPIGDQHAMAMKVDAFRAHVSGGRFIGEFEEFVDAAAELKSKHVVGVIAKTVIPQRDIGRVVADFLAAASEGGKPDVTDVRGGERFLERLPIKVRQAAGHGNRPDVDQVFD